MSEPVPERVSLQDLYDALPQVMDAEEFDVEANLAKLHRWIEEDGE